MTEHSSDCAVHNAPAMKPGPCDCKDPVTTGKVAVTKVLQAVPDLLLEDVLILGIGKDGRRYAACSDGDAEARKMVKTFLDQLDSGDFDDWSV